MKLRASPDYEGQDIKGVLEAVHFRAG